MRIKLPLEIEKMESSPHKKDLIRHYKKRARKPISLGWKKSEKELSHEAY